ncbi:adenylyl-sulfate kinase [Alphaproteobacteria bacterium]|nr:adenylyl-sulfate kinase [Alphaproteobacteria bacterium]MDC1023085.1 adenylyl-sulfate kinase [Alphaproteobacteria bacterium]
MKSNLYWITGLSGAGKTTIGTLFYSYLQKIKKNVIYLDGDNLREIFGVTQEYSLSDRKTLAMRYSRLCKMLTEQDMDVVICTISMFNEVRKWNRENISNYKEIYIKVPMKILIDRDQKQLYSRALRGEIKDVMGVDVEVDEPDNPDIIINNDGSSTPEKMTYQLFGKLKLNSKQIY